MITIIVPRENMTLDQVIWEKTGRNDEAILRATLDANPGLAALGSILPAGHSFTLPEQTPPVERKTVRLWD